QDPTRSPAARPRPAVSTRPDRWLLSTDPKKIRSSAVTFAVRARCHCGGVSPVLERSERSCPVGQRSAKNLTEGAGAGKTQTQHRAPVRHQPRCTTAKVTPV